MASQGAPTGNFPNLIAFLQFWKWLGPYLKDFIHRDSRYQTYPSGKDGIFQISAPPGDGPLKIAVAADWGTGTLEADVIAENITNCSPHYTVHLGDVYYMGEATEISENCLGQTRKPYDGVYWPLGSRGSFALMGNHEMYSGGQGYFQTFLTRLGELDSNKKVTNPQSASYFCLEADNWVVFGLDTGYHSGGMPLFTSIPGLNAIPFLNVDARFDNIMVAWLKDTIQTLQSRPNQKSVLLLSHHQPFSTFEHAFPKPAKQLADLEFLKGREFVWLYGHEHRLTVYRKQEIVNALTAHPRCIGHGGMPVEVTKINGSNGDVLFYDPRQHPIDDKDPNTLVGYNGHVVLMIDGPTLTIEYHDIVNNDLLLTETFKPQEMSGALEYSRSLPPSSPLLSGKAST